MKIPALSPQIKPKKIALLLSALLATTTFSAFSAPVKYTLDASTPSDQRTVNITNGDEISRIDINVADGRVDFADNITMNSTGVVNATGSRNVWFAYLKAGEINLGNHFTLNFDPRTNGTYSTSDGIALYGTGKLTAENYTFINMNDSEESDGLYVGDNARADLKGLTTIRGGGISAGSQGILNAENIDIAYTRPGIRESGDSTDTGMALWGGKVTVTGNTTINIVSPTFYLEGIRTYTDLELAGHTDIQLTSNSTDRYSDVTGILIFDSFTSSSLSGKRVFNDVSIKIKSTTEEGYADGLTYLGGNGKHTDLIINKIDIDSSGNDIVRGIYLWGDDPAETATHRINDAKITLSGNDKATLWGFFSANVNQDDGIVQWDADTIVGNIAITSKGGKESYLLYQADALFTGDVILGDRNAYESVADTLYSIYGRWGSTDITNNNKLVAWGKMLVRGDHAINIVSGDNSYIYGDTAIEEQGSINMELNGSNSRWDMIANSTLTTLTLNDATLNFMPGDTASRTLTRDAATFKTLTVNGDYAGNNGNLVMNTQLGDDASPTDKLVVQGNTSGNTNVTVLNAGGAGGLTTNGIELISVAGNSDGVFTQNGRIVAGAYDYTLARGEGQNDKNWYLTSALSTEPQPEPQEPLAPVDPVEPSPTPRENAVRPEAGLYGMNLQAANTMFNTRLHDRLGETHYVDALTGENAVTSLWLRNVGGHTRQKDSSGQLDMQANRYVMQLGGDIAQWSSDNTDRFHLGLMAGYANQKARAENQRNGNRADSRISGYSVGLYGTWLQDNETHEGAYVDSWAQYSWFDNTVSGRGVESEEYDSKGFTASVESGYTWKLADISERNALYIQPKAQVTWMGVKADEHREANGTRVEGHGDGNVQTRVGVRVFGKGHNKLDDGKGRTFQPFVEANWIHNSKDFGVSMNGDNVDLDGTRNIGELKAGVEGLLTKNVSLWGNVAQQVGDKGYSDTSAMLGIKASF
ncbi:TPA: autotransporter outer membrane beta-barrel domain-containing protein [Citrobacter sedlakii]|nr:autotransporter outer membrane beta-barrel domain-containing protein [Citrobacter sedlakii]